MPAEPTVPAPAASYSGKMRNRDSCWKCKERHLRCTLERPTCKRCARSGHECRYGKKLLWKEDALARGICHGRQGVYGQKKSESPISNTSLGLRCFTGRFYFLNTGGDDYQDRNKEDAGHPDLPKSGQCQESSDTDCQMALEAIAPSSGLYFGNLTLPGMGGRDIQIFDYYIHELCPQLSNSLIDNPYLDLLAPLSMQSPSVYHSILSWSAHEFSLRSPSMQHYRHSSVMHKVKALKCLQDELQCSQRDSSQPSQALIPILATVIILSCQEITESCSAAWITHLKAARTLCSLLWPAGLHRTDRFRKFCVMWLVSHEMMSRTAWIEQTLFEPNEWFEGDDEWEIDSMIGCSRGLIRSVSEIGELIMERRLDARNAGSVPFLTRRDCIERTLQSLGQHMSNTEPAAFPELQDVAESKRLCALIYLYTCIDDATPTTPIIQETTASVVNLLRKLPSKPSLTFPLFVVGTLGVWNEDDRRLVIDKFTQLIELRPLASIRRAFEIVKEVWIDRDLGHHHRWEDLVERRGKLLSLA